MGLYYEVKLMLEKILRRLEKIDSKISAIAQDLKMPRGKTSVVCITTAIDSTVQALQCSREPMLAAQVAAVTGRARALESMHLNELVRNGMVVKEKRGRQRVFSIREIYRRNICSEESEEECSS
jgi:DNA-binding transcriptional ArsR family regulator